MRYLNNLFDIREGEWHRLLLLYGLAFLLNMSVVWGQAASEALFLKRIGVEYLPLMFIADAILNIIAIIIYGAFVDRLSNTRLMLGIAVCGALSLLVMRVSLLLDTTLVYAILYLLERALKALISIHAWTYIADFYDTRTAKRHFSFIASASRPSGILAGLLIFPLVQLGGTENLLFAWVGVLLLSGALAWIVPKQVPLVINQKDGPSASFRTRYGEGFQYVISSSFLRYLAIAAVVGTILLYLLDYQSQLIFVSSFSSSEELATFYGLLGAFSDLLILPIQMVLLPRLVTRFGVGKANLIFPALTNLSYILVSLLPMLPTAAFARMDRNAFRSAFRTPIDGLLYNAVSVALKGRARAFINGLLVPIGSLIVGLILLLINRNAMSVFPVMIFGFLMVAIYMIVSWKIKHEYSNALAALLIEDDMSLFWLTQQHSDGLDQTDPATIARIKQRIQSSTDDDLTIFLAELLSEIQGHDAFPYLETLAKESKARIQAGIIQLLGTLSAPLSRDFCVKALKSPHANVRHTAATVLAQSPDVQQDKELLDLFHALLNDRDEQVQAAVMAPLIESDDRHYLAPAVKRLTKWLNAKSRIDQRTLGLRVLAQRNNKHLFSTLVCYLNDTEPVLRRQAVELIDQIAAHTQIESIEPSALDILRQQLSNEDESVRLASVKALAHVKSEEANHLLLIALKDGSFMVRSHACTVISPVPQLEQVLTSDNPYLAESAAYILASRPRTKRKAMKLIENILIDVYTIQGKRLALDGFTTSSAELLKNMLQEEADQLLQRVFWLLARLSNEEKVQAIQRALPSENALTRANAAETLEAISSPRLSSLITPLFDKTSLNKLVETAQELLALPTQNAWHFFCQVLPQLGSYDPTPASFNLRPLYEDEWLTAMVIYTLWEIRGTILTDEQDRSFRFNKSHLLPVLKHILNHTSSDMVHETASLVLDRIGNQSDAHPLLRRLEYVNDGRKSHLS